jgi:hypothetical protein
MKIGRGTEIKVESRLVFNHMLSIPVSCINIEKATIERKLKT